MRSASNAVAITTLALLLGCSKQDGIALPSSAPPSGPEQVAATTDKWVGQWNGPEGTFLRITGANGKYEVTVRNLDGPRSFAGSAAQGRIEFERDGVKESLRATDGAGTGMKWLADKSDCLMVRAGEGYCRP
jgi:hypothetical protein